MTTFELRVPDIGEGLAEVEIVEWLTSVGATIREGDPVVAVETDKAEIEIPSTTDGVVVELRGERGTIIPVGDVYALLTVDESAAGLDPVSDPPVGGGDGRAEDPLDHEAALAPSDTPTRTAPPRDGGAARRRAAPAVRRLANQLGVDIETVQGSGPGGRVVAADVEAHAAASTPAEAAAQAHSPAGPTRDAGTSPPSSGLIDRRERITGIRRRMAATMTAAAQVPHITSHREVDATELFAWRSRTLEAHPDDAAIYTFTPFFAICVIGALARVPELNAHFAPDAEELTQFASVGLGIATATPGGLVVPVVHHAERLGLHGLARDIDRLKTAGRDGQLRPEDMAGGTFTVTNFGANGGWFGTPLLRLPEIGIAGVGRAAMRPWVVDGEVVPRPILPISVSVDHRVVDGELSARFTNHLIALLGSPLEILSQDPPWL